jgi:hypothetical protein
MAIGASLAALVVVLVVAAGLGLDVRSVTRRVFRLFKSEPPVYQWVQSEDKTLTFLPGEGKAWGPVEPQGGEIHYVINAYLPVDIGLMESEKWTESMEGWRAMKTSSICYQARTKSSSKACSMPTGKPYLIFIRDLRAKQFGLGGLNTGVVNPKSLEEQNNVTITVFTRKCLENCP